MLLGFDHESSADSRAATSPPSRAAGLDWQQLSSGRAKPVDTAPDELIRMMVRITRSVLPRVGLYADSRCFEAVLNAAQPVSRVMGTAVARRGPHAPSS